MAPHFRKLPDELVAHIILQLPMADILRCRTVSKHINSLVQNSSVIQYKIELTANGLVSCPGSNFSSATSLHRLKEQQDAWRRCEWKEECVIQLSTGCRTYELRNGIWAFGQSDVTQDSTLPPDYTSTITCFRLPSGTTCKEKETDVSQWSLENLGMSIRDFTMDPLVDLLALVEQTVDGTVCPFRIHIRRLSDGQPHEMAAIHTLDFEMNSSDPSSCAFGVQLQGSFIGVLVRQDPRAGDYDHLAIWNWRTGSKEVLLEATTCSFDDFAFIDTSSVILAVLDHPVVLQVWCFHTSHAYFAGSFAMPVTTTKNGYLELHFDGGPSPSPAGATTLDGTPFTLAPIPEIIAMTFGVIDTDPDLQETEVAIFAMVMQPSLMLKALEKQYRDEVREPSQFAGRRSLEWEAWGPQCTRWIPQDTNHLHWEPFSVGGRFAIVTPSKASEVLEQPGSTEPQVIRLYDFRPDMVSRYKDQFPDDTFCIEPSIIPKDTMFQADIVSSLPYHVTTSKDLTQRVSGVMMDECRLVCTKAEFDDEWRSLIVFTF
ncbi:hypothetical protein K439DRAFT_1627078 [Ramaria rubella]|nr:hypothetical protein K439DRAFT_1627078 [Ramaria rubella]